MPRGGAVGGEIRYALHPAVTAQLIVLTEKSTLLPTIGCRKPPLPCWMRGEKSHLHLTTASLLADAARQTAGNELLFRAVHHVSAALDCIQPAPQRQRFRELSLQAAACEAYRRLPFRFKLYPDRQRLGNAGPSRTFMLDIEEAGCEFALGHLERTRAVRCDPRFTGRADGESAGRQPAGGSLYAPVGDPPGAGASLCWLGVFGIQISRYPENAECDEAWQQFCQRPPTRRRTRFLSLS